MACFRSGLALALFVSLVAGIGAQYNYTGPELAQREQFPAGALQFDYPTTSILSNSLAGTTYSLDESSMPILKTLPDPGLSGKIDNFEPCSIKVPHVHPRGSKFSYVVTGTLHVGIAEEDTGRILNFNVSEGSAIVVPQGLLHTMRNMDCTQPLKMLTVFNNVDAGELTMLDKILGFPMDVVLASTGLDEATVNTFNSSLPRAAGDLRVDTACLAACGLNPSSESVLPPSVAASTAGK